MKTNRHSSTSLGITSLITFFTVLVLVSFSLLVTTTARNDAELSTRAANSVTEYYEADAIAEQKLAELHNLLINTPAESIEQILNQSFFNILQMDESGDMIIEYEVPVNDIKILKVKIGVNLNELDTLHRVSWQTIII